MPALKAVQRMLLRLGIIGRIHENQERAGEGGMKAHRASLRHELVISGENTGLFSERVGFQDPVKQGKLMDGLGRYGQRMEKEPFAATVDRLVPDGIEEVFDVTVPGKTP